MFTPSKLNIASNILIAFQGYVYIVRNLFSFKSCTLFKILNSYFFFGVCLLSISIANWNYEEPRESEHRMWFGLQERLHLGRVYNISFWLECTKVMIMMNVHPFYNFSEPVWISLEEQLFSLDAFGKSTNDLSTMSIQNWMLSCRKKKLLISPGSPT